MKDYGYERWVDYIEELFTRSDFSPSTMVDIACGTGNMTILLAEKGYDIIGIDSSEDMLYMAKEKSLSKGLNIPFIHQDIRNLALHGPVDVITCMCDGFNYILSKGELITIFKKIYELLNRQGFLIFDISSYYKLSTILGDNIMADASEDISLIWFNTFDGHDDICCMDLTFFVSEGCQYRRFDETHYQRAYRLKDVEILLANARFSNIQVFHPFTFEPPKADSHRWVFIAQKL